MLQDMVFGRLENEFRNIAAAEMATPRYLFRMHEQNFFLRTDAAPASPVGFSYEPVRTLRQLRSKEICYAVMAGWYSRHALPAKDDGISLTREMIRIFEEGKEPK